ncbi:MAG: hypothetical protein ACTSWW_01295 [Promethearchaeota archaeon]
MDGENDEKEKGRKNGRQQQTKQRFFSPKHLARRGCSTRLLKGDTAVNPFFLLLKNKNLGYKNASFFSYDKREKGKKCPQKIK